MSDKQIRSNQRKVWASTPISPSRWGVPTFVWLAISSFSPRKEDAWAREIDFPYQIVLLPGYQCPEALVKEDIDAIWFEGDVISPVVVWDSYRPENLFELISISFDPASEMASFIKVRDKRTGEFLEDPRPSEMMSRRPPRDFEGEMVSAVRNVKRGHYLTKPLPTWYGMWFKYMKDRSTSWRFKSFFTPFAEDCPDNPSNVWAELVAEHPRVAKENLFKKTTEGMKTVEGLRFGYSLFKQEAAKLPSWYEAQVALETGIMCGSEEVWTPLSVAIFKQDRGIPLESEDRRLLKKMKDPKQAKVGGLMERLSSLTSWK